MYPKKPKTLNKHDILRRDLRLIYSEWSNEWDQDLPKKWKIAQDLIILPSNCFQLKHWFESTQFYPTLTKVFNVNRIAQENKVKSDDFRSPNLTLLYGDSSIVTVNNNGIKYCYDITKCMFSWGNITEKLRIASFDCSNETVVDLYAGIGYFTLVYLVHAKAKNLIACEWNPASVEALKNNLKLNNCEERCIVLLGDNRQTCPVDVADRVNLGLIPSSESSWKTACHALKKQTGGFLHIHGNVDIHSNEKQRETKYKREWIEWAEYAQSKILTLLNERTELSKWKVTIEHIEYVKSYGPRVDHLVLDLKCKPDLFEKK